MTSSCWSKVDQSPNIKTFEPTHEHARWIFARFQILVGGALDSRRSKKMNVT
jgi:hypothetical protein